MKHLRRYLCVLLCCVLSLGVFSVSVSAEELGVKPYHIYNQQYLLYDGGRWDSYGTLIFYPNNGTEEKRETWINVDPTQYNTYGSPTGCSIYEIAFDDATTMFQKGVKTTVKLENIYHRYLVMCTTCNSTEYVHDISVASFTVNYVDGTYAFHSPEFTVSGGDLDIKVTFTPTNDVKSIAFTLYTPINVTSHNGHHVTTKVVAYFGEYSGDNKYNLTIQQPSEEAGLLSGIWGELTSGFNALGEKLTNVWNSITDGFANIGSKLTDVWNSIIELPSKLWELIENGLKSLFVPDEEYIKGYKERWEESLGVKLGAVWQVMDVTFESWDNINANDVSNTIDLPLVTIPLPQNNKFSFGGDTVQVVPDGFEELATLCKVACGIVSTFMLVSGLRKRYDEIMGVEQ